MKKVIILVGVILILFAILMSGYDTWESLYWPEASYEELFSNESEGINVVYNGLQKQYRIEINENNGAVKQLRIIEEVHIPKGHEEYLEDLRDFYEKREQSDVYNHDIVNFIHDIEHDSYSLTMVVDCEEIDLDKHGNLLDFIGLSDSLDVTTLSYELYKERLLEMGFSLRK